MSLLLVVWPGDPSRASLLLVVRSGATSSFLLLVVWPGAFIPTSDARSP